MLRNQKKKFQKKISKTDQKTPLVTALHMHIQFLFKKKNLCKESRNRNEEFKNVVTYIDRTFAEKQETRTKKYKKK